MQEDRVMWRTAEWTETESLLVIARSLSRGHG
jgi:hypothetical protein